MYEHFEPQPGKPPLSEKVARSDAGDKAASFLDFAGTWKGDDFEECLDFVYRSRSQAKF